MRDLDDNPLDNSIWHALSTVHSRFALGTGHARRYPPAIAPFAATLDLTNRSVEALTPLLAPNETVALFSATPIKPRGSLVALRRATVEQMVLSDAGITALPPGPEPAALGVEDVPQMLALAERTKPGPFSPGVTELGSYVGLRRAGLLVGMCGERLRLPGFAEISAVCVDADARGLGFAAALVTSVASAIVERSECPFLHVFSTNKAAIRLYEKLGFVIRRQLHLVILGHAAS